MVARRAGSRRPGDGPRRDGALAAGRAALAERRWDVGVERLTAADAAGALEGVDLDGLGEACWWLGRLEDAIKYRERAFTAHRDAGDRVPAARAALALVADYTQRAEESMAAGWLRQAERLLDGVPECAAHGWLLRPLVNRALGRGDLDAALPLADRILEIGSRLGDRDLETIGLQDRGRVLVALGRVTEGLNALDEAVVSAVSGEMSAYPTAMVYCNATIACEDLTDYRRAGEFAKAAERWCSQQAIAGFPGMCRVRSVEIIRLSGAWERAEAEARRACAELMGFSPEYAAEGYYQIGEIRRRMGDSAGAEEAFEQAHRLGRDPLPGMALVLLGHDRADAAAAMLAGALADSTLAPLARARMLPAEVQIAVAVRDLGRADAGARELEAIAATYGTHFLRAEAAMARGTVSLATGDAEGAVSALRAAVRAWQATEAPYETARARMALGEAFLASGGAAAAALEFSAAAAAFETLGADVDLADAHRRSADRAASPASAGRARRATRTFMFTDVVGSTGLIDAVGDEAWGRLLAWHDATIRGLLREHGGQEVHHAGDGFFVAFESADAALDCAIAIRRTFDAHRRAHGFATSIRIGLHTAEALHTASGYEGGAVHAAARIGGLAGAEEILVSRQTATAASRAVAHGPWRTERLRGLRGPFEIAALG